MDERKELYLEQVRSLNFYEEAIMQLRLEDSNTKEIEEVINDTITLFKQELMLRRKEMLHMYGCITSYIEAIDDIKADYDSYEEGEADNAIDSFIENINKLFCDIDNAGLELESFKEAIEFCEYMIRANKIADKKDEEDIG